MAAFQQAFREGVDGIEFDVRLAKDNMPVVIHDATLQRTAGFSGRVSRYTSAELAKIDVGSWFNQKRASKANQDFVGQTVPTLPQMLDMMRDRDGLIYLEMKCSKDTYAPLVESVAAILEKSGMMERVIVKSFRLEALEKIRKRLPDARIAVLFAPEFKHLLKPKNRLVTKALELGANEISLHYSLATPSAMREADAYNFPVTIWTADHPIWVKRAENLGVRAIITNKPARLLARRDELHASTVTKQPA